MTQYIDQYIVEFISKTNKAAADTKKLAAANDQLVTTYAKAGKNNKRFNAQLQNSSYQIADFAVQVGGGTSALRAFSQQAPQLLAGFGAIGAAVGAVTAILAAGANSLFNFGDAAKELDSSLDTLKLSLTAIGNSQQGPMGELVTALEKADEVTKALIFSQLGLQRIKLGQSLGQAQEDINKYISGLVNYTETIGVSIDGIAVGVSSLEGDAAKLEGIKENFNVSGDVAGSILGLLNAFDGTAEGATELATGLNQLAEAGKIEPKYLEDLNALLQIIQNLGGALKSTVPELEKITVKVKKLSDAKLDPSGWNKFGESIKDAVNPARVYYRQLEKLRRALALGKIEADEYAIAVDQLQDKFLKLITVPKRKLKKPLEEIKTLTEEIKEETKGWSDALADDIVSGLAEGKLAFEDFASYVIQQLARIALSKALEPLFNAFGSFIDGAIPSAAPTGLIAVPVNDLPISREMGGTQQMLVGTPRMSAPTSSGSPVTVNVYNQGSDNVEVNERKTTRGVEIDVLIKSTVKRGIASGDFDKVMATSYGARRMAY